MGNNLKLKNVLRLIADGFSQGLEEDLFRLLFTANELEHLATRYGIIRGLVSKKHPQRELAGRLGVSIEKITRGSNELKRTPVRLVKHLEKFFNEEAS